VAQPRLGSRNGSRIFPEDQIMRMMLPTVRERRTVDRLLRAFFLTYRKSDFRRAIATICGF